MCKSSPSQVRNWLDLPISAKQRSSFPTTTMTECAFVTNGSLSRKRSSLSKMIFCWSSHILFVLLLVNPQGTINCRWKKQNKLLTMFRRQTIWIPFDSRMRNDQPPSNHFSRPLCSLFAFVPSKSKQTNAVIKAKSSNENLSMHRAALTAVYTSDR